MLCLAGCSVIQHSSIITCHKTTPEYYDCRVYDSELIYDSSIGISRRIPIELKFRYKVNTTLDIEESIVYYFKSILVTPTENVYTVTFN